MQQLRDEIEMEAGPLQPEFGTFVGQRCVVATPGVRAALRTAEH